MSKAIELLKRYIDNYTEENKHKTSPAMIKFHLEEYYQAIAELEQKPKAGEFTKKAREAWPTTNKYKSWWQRQLSDACDFLDEANAKIKELEEKIERMEEATSNCVGIIRASSQVNTKLLADKLEQSPNRKER